ncbi:hypothetical protein G7046_g8736 [Stylonectria norvegica]|nr:hypothetical protein G7046_g8736 [Stylonectria norvegica]
MARAVAEDWIYDGALSPFDNTKAVLATAHNEVVQVEYDEVSGTLRLDKVVVSPSRPMLYTANLTWLARDTVLVAGGTVFGDILVWKCHLARGVPELLAELVGHEGSIFGVHLSDELTLGDGSTVRLLASCSDDRTVRIWDVTEGREGESAKREVGAPRETGFGTRATEKEGAVAVVMGHASRIWGVKFAVPEGGVLGAGGMSVYSFGEDATTQRWQLDIDTSLKDGSEAVTTKTSWSLTHQETLSLHDGKHLWSHALLSRDGQLLIATGGADGKISLITEPSSRGSSNSFPNTPHRAHGLTTLSLDDILTTLPAPLAATTRRETFNRLDFITPDQILATTTLGRLLLGTFSPELEVRELEIDSGVAEDWEPCYVLRKIGHGKALLGATTGSLYHYSNEKGISRVCTLPGKIVDITCLTGSDDSDDGSVDVLVNVHGVSNPHCLTLDNRTGAIQKKTDIRGIDSRFVPVSAAKVRGDLLAIGSRHGWLSILRRTDDEYRPVLNSAPRTGNAITAIVALPARQGSAATAPYFLTTSRDGKYRIFEIEDDGKDIHLHLRHETSPPFGPMIEGAWFTEDVSPELIIYGFRSKHLVIWNETRQEELAAVDCGGAHRAFALTRDTANSKTLRFAFTKASKLSVYSKHGAAHRPLKRGIHGREIRSLSTNSRYVATGAEDTSIRIWEYQKKQGPVKERELRCLASMNMHIAGIQHIQWLGEEYLFSSAGNEEFLVWRVRRLDASYGGLAVMCEAVFDDKSVDKDLRIMDFDVYRIGNGGNILVTMALSNSALKTYRYTPGHGFQLLAQMSYTGACLTQVRHLGVDENGASVLTASTDGHLATWEVDLNLDGITSHTLVQVAPVHQSCIKSLDLRPTSDGYQVLTGGDDNALGVTAITPLPENEGDDAITRRYTVSSRGIVRKAHAAAINGVVLVQRREQTLGVSVSNDQRVKVWEIGSDKVRLLEDAYSGVADAGDVGVLGGDGCKVIVGGVGVEVWSLR